MGNERPTREERIEGREDEDLAHDIADRLIAQAALRAAEAIQRLMVVHSLSRDEMLRVVYRGDRSDPLYSEFLTELAEVHREWPVEHEEVA
jgi:hypothetical protein